MRLVGATIVGNEVEELVGFLSLAIREKSQLKSIIRNFSTSVKLLSNHLSERL